MSVPSEMMRLGRFCLGRAAGETVESKWPPMAWSGSSSSSDDAASEQAAVDNAMKARARRRACITFGLRDAAKLASLVTRQF